MGVHKAISIMAQELAKHEEGFSNILPPQQEHYIRELEEFLGYLAYNQLLRVNDDYSMAVIAGSSNARYTPSSVGEHLLYAWVQGYWSGVNMP